MLGLITVGMGQTLLFTVLGPSAREIGLKETDTGLIIALSALTMAVTSPYWGRLINKLGSKFVFVFGLFCFGIGSLLFALVLQGGIDNIYSAQTTLISLILIRIIYAFMIAGVHPAAMTYLVDTTDEKARTAGISLLGASYSIGSIIGPSLAVFNSKDSILIPIFISAGISIASAILALFVLSNTKRGGSETQVTNANLKIIDKRILPFIVGLILSGICISTVQQNLAFFIQDLLFLDSGTTAQYVGISFASLASAMLFTQLYLIQHFKPSLSIMLKIGSFLTTIGLVVLALSDNFVMIIVAQIILGFGFGYFIPGVQSAASLSVSSREQGAVAGIIFSALALGYVVGPLFGTVLFGVTPSLPYFVCALFMLCSFCFTLRFKGIKNNSL